ncbi:hypothetical protein DM01DRAFT_1382076 [Hesseltinella vesiculosa]|uniref:Uncharacterized protein n=1 Tax=Hesseltinella vesiculosa TaxID=101127 RepID=A0A1X2GMZ9_9FUNG|nr:hypothetical protein DM01DRAFT_1382076 [Hesseltinella vesiculosa]
MEEVQAQPHIGLLKSDFVGVTTALTFDSAQSFQDNLNILRGRRTERCQLLFDQVTSYCQSARSAQDVNAIGLVFCRDCGQEGHVTKVSQNCPHHSATAPMIDLTSTNPDVRSNIQAERQAGRQARRAGAANPQAVARGRLRPRKEAFYSDLMGPNRTRYTRKLSFNQAVPQSYHRRQAFLEMILRTSHHLREIMIRIGLFLNHFILTYPEELNTAILEQNGLSKIFALVRGDQVVTETFAGQLPEHLVDHFRLLQAALAELPGSPSLTYSSDVYALTVNQALKSMSTGYVDTISDHFDKKLKRYMKWRLDMAAFESSSVIPTWLKYKIVDITYTDFALHLPQSPIQDIDLVAGLDDIVWPAEVTAGMANIQRVANTVRRSVLKAKPAHVQVLTPKYIKKNPQQVVAMLMIALTDIETYLENPVEEVKVQRFAILPEPHWHLRYVNLVPENIHFYTGTRRVRPSTSQAATPDVDYSLPSALLPLAQFWDVFNFQLFGYNSAADLSFPLTHDPLEAVSTNGIEVNFTFSTMKLPTPIKDVKLTDLPPLDARGSQEFAISTIDPGRRVTISQATNVQLSSVNDLPGEQHGQQSQVTPGCSCLHPDSLDTRPTATRDLPMKRATSAEFTAQSGSKQRAKKLDATKTAMEMVVDGVTTTFKAFESSLPTKMTVNTILYLERVRLILTHIGAIATIYDINFSIQRFNGYRGGQRAVAFAANVVMNGGKKYTKENRNPSNTRRNRRSRRRKCRKKRRSKALATMHSAAQDWASDPSVPVETFLRQLESISQRTARPQPSPPMRRPSNVSSLRTNDHAMPLICFGQGMKGRMAPQGFRGHQPGASGRIYKLLKELSCRGLCLVADLDEFRTSRLCPEHHCRHQRLDPYQINGQSSYALKSCNICHTVLDRDVLAVRNMAIIATGWLQHQHRPLPWRRGGSITT